MISNCGKDEHGTYSGGQAGDQTGKEYALIGWYNRPWNCVLRHPDATVREEIAKLARAAALNDKIGYDQYQRLTFWNELAKVGYNPSAITTPCEADCSSSTAAVVKAAGYRLKNEKLKGISQSLTTYGMRSALRNAGFDVLTDSRYLTSDAHLLLGDILLNDQAHVAINVTNGSHADTSYGAKQPSNSAISPGNTSIGSGGTTTLPSTTNVKRGDIVSLAQDAVWWSGGTIPSWVLAKNWTVFSINGMRAVLGRSEDGAHNIMSPINAGYLKVVKTETGKSVTASTAPETPKENASGLGSEYVVQPGDTLWGIANKWCGKGWKWTEIQKANGMTNSNIYVGQVLKLPGKE